MSTEIGRFTIYIVEHSKPVSSVRHAKILEEFDDALQKFLRVYEMLSEHKEFRSGEFSFKTV